MEDTYVCMSSKFDQYCDLRCWDKMLFSFRTIPFWIFLMQVRTTLIDRKQVLSNSGIASILVVLITLITGGKDKCLDSKESGLVTALIGGVIGHYSCCNGDTWSSELGILSKSEPRIITTLKVCMKSSFVIEQNLSMNVISLFLLTWNFIRGCGRGPMAG